MALRIGDEAPNFTAQTTEGEIDFHQYIDGHWAVLFSHPADYTPVCTTELGHAANLKPEFDRRNVKMLAISVDPVDSHKGWVNDINETQNCTMNYPIIADPDHKVAELYDMIHPGESEKMTVRSVFIIGPDKKIKAMITYPPSTGRNFDEILRAIDALRVTSEQAVATPVNWRDGDECIVPPHVSDEEAKEKYPKGVRTLKPYLRYTPQPNR